MVAANAGQAVAFSLTAGNAGDGPEGRELMEKIKGNRHIQLCDILMDRAYEGNATREKAFECNFNPVVPPNPKRIEPWQYDATHTKNAMRLNACFGGLRGFAEFLLATIKLT